jgi:SAM-dependent methyltransferase
MSRSNCRFCGRTLTHVFADLGTSPLANSYLTAEQLAAPEPTYPLKVMVCDDCFLVQLPELASPAELFTDYAYFSSYSDTWLRHAERYAEAMISRFALAAEQRVVEIASNDGYLLQYFQRRGVPVLGVEPARNVAAAAEKAGIPTLVEFFGRDLAGRLASAGRRADLLVGNNVLAHVPDINDFVAGLALALAPGGVVTMEFPHLLRLMEENQFDTIYHEHFSYLSFDTTRRIFARHGLTLFDVDELPTHGGSLRIYGCHRADESKTVTAAVAAMSKREQEAGLGTLEPYRRFDERVRETRRRLLGFLAAARRDGKTIAAYGAAAKGNTLLNYCGIGAETIDYVVDRSPHKQGCYLPGTRLPIHPPARLFETRPDLVFILPWNIKEEVMEQMAGVREWGARFFVAIPEVGICG